MKHLKPYIKYTVWCVSSRMYDKIVWYLCMCVMCVCGSYIIRFSRIENNYVTRRTLSESMYIYIFIIRVQKTSQKYAATFFLRSFFFIFLLLFLSFSLFFFSLIERRLVYVLEIEIQYSVYSWTETRYGSNSSNSNIQIFIIFL